MCVMATQLMAVNVTERGTCGNCCHCMQVVHSLLGVVRAPVMTTGIHASFANAAETHKRRFQAMKQSSAANDLIAIESLATGDT